MRRESPVAASANSQNLADGSGNLALHPSWVTGTRSMTDPFQSNPGEAIGGVAEGGEVQAHSLHQRKIEGT